VLHALDLALLRFLRARGHSPAAEAVALALGRAGEHGLAWYAAAGVGAALDAKRRPVYLRALQATLASYLANQLLKFAVRRRRPRLEDLPPLMDTFSNLSYPSAHAATSFAAARVLPWPGLYPVATAVAISRPYLGVHYPSDALAGAVLGLAVAELVP
jgi:membrane-associated phospholipid phosphatase